MRYCVSAIAALTWRGFRWFIWTQLGHDNYEVCALFNINGYVSKWEGHAALREVLVKLVSEFSQE
jgi:hypothetical protein